jgi:cell division protein FtsL
MPAVSTHDPRRATHTKLRVVLVATAALVFLVCISMVFNDRGGIGELQQARKRVDSLHADVRRLQSENARLSAEVQSAKKSTYAVERIAREDLGMSKKGEVVYMLLPKKH